MATAKKGTILVVDDEEIMREILETLLVRDGYDVRLASSGQEGLDLARAMPFDAAIVDIMMPGLDGITTLDELKRIDEDLAVLIITAVILVATVLYLMRILSGRADENTYKNYRHGVARALLLGLPKDADSGDVYALRTGA